MVDRLLGRNREAPPDAPLDAKADVWRRVQLARNLRRPSGCGVDTNRPLGISEELGADPPILTGERVRFKLMARRFYIHRIGIVQGPKHPFDHAALLCKGIGQAAQIMGREQGPRFINQA